MAHVGTSMDLAKQPAKTGSGQVGLWKALLAAIVVVAIGVGIVMAASFIVRSNPATVVRTADHSYDKIEAMRGAARDATTTSATQVDLSYNSLRGVRNAPVAGAPMDLSYNSLRGPRGATYPTGGSTGAARLLPNGSFEHVSGPVGTANQP